MWALSELPQGELAVASTSGQIFDNSARNHFVVLAESDKQLKKIGETPDYGAKEDIRSVRFLGSMAYVVTFKKTDPLFAIDVSEASNPRILGELKIPGFSTYMHPLNKDRLIGLGFDAIDAGAVAYYQGLQLSLFNTSDPRNLSRSDVRVLGQRGSGSAATTDHRAFFMDNQQGVVAFPVQLNLHCQAWNGNCNENLQSSIPAQMLGQQGYEGAAVVRVENDSLREPLFVSHAELRPMQCGKPAFIHNWWSSSSVSSDIQRIFKIDGEMVSISKFALKTFRLAEKLETLISSQWNANCNGPQFPGRR